VIHVATVHWRDARWLEPQRRYLERNLEGPHRVYADLEGIEGDEGFDVVTTLPVTAEAPSSHAAKLNALAELIARGAEPGDVLIFLDGDAFPVAPLDSFLEQTLARFPLAAIRRDENLGDKQPHPAFCATTVGFWQELGGDWSRGPEWTWTNDLGWTVEDTGGKLLAALTEKRVDWYALRRTNRVDLHPVLFGLYDDLVYHHGAGFRQVFDRVDRLRAGLVPDLPAGLPPDPPASRAGRLLWKVRAKRWYLAEKRPIVKREQRLTRRNVELSEQVYGWLQEDDSFYLRV
jgi:hypothetical protein